MRFDFALFFSLGKKIPWNHVFKMMHEHTNKFFEKWGKYSTSLKYYAEQDVSHFGEVKRLVNKDSKFFRKAKNWLL